MLLQHVLNIIESVAPLEWQEEWDNSGLQIGNRNAEVHAALLTTDVTEAVVDEAVGLNCDLIVSHHPLLFHGLKSIAGTTPQERCVIKAIQNNIAIYSSHTSMDSYLDGVSGYMAQKLGIADYRLLCTSDNVHGLGVVGRLPEQMCFNELLALVKSTFSAEGLRFISPEGGFASPVQNIAICGGAGAEFMEQAVSEGADVFISSDFKYHEMQQAEARIALIDIDHWTSEHFTTEIFGKILREHIPAYISKADKTPIRYYF